MCRMRYADVSPEAAIVTVSSYPERYRRTPATLHSEALRQRPEPEVWSILEYACHVRDVYDVYTYRMKHAIIEENPVLEPMYNDRRAALDRYNDQDPCEVLDALARQAGQFAAQAALLTPDQHSRTVTRSTGEERTVLWLLRQAAHESIHHHYDIELICEQISPLYPARPAGGGCEPVS